jgi:hypothetical protein
MHQRIWRHWLKWKKCLKDVRLYINMLKFLKHLKIVFYWICLDCVWKICGHFTERIRNLEKVKKVRPSKVAIRMKGKHNSIKAHKLREPVTTKTKTETQFLKSTKFNHEIYGRRVNRLLNLLFGWKDYIISLKKHLINLILINKYKTKH